MSSCTCHIDQTPSISEYLNIILQSPQLCSLPQKKFHWHSFGQLVGAVLNAGFDFETYRSEECVKFFENQPYLLPKLMINFKSISFKGLSYKRISEIKVNRNILLMCKVLFCKENHKNHYCRLCDQTDSTHLASNCPKGIFLYHGTKVQSIQPILKTSLKPSTDGRLGPGLYLTLKQYAGKIAQYRQDSGISVIFQVWVNPNKCLKGDHPAWANINHKFPEWCALGYYKVTKLIIIYNNGTEVEKTLS